MDGFTIILILLCLLGVSLLVFTVLNIISAVKMHKKLPIVIECVLYAFLLGLFVFPYFQNIGNNGSDVYGKGLLTSITFQKEDNDYYYFIKSDLMSEKQFVIPRAQAELPMLVKNRSHVYIYCEKSTELFNGSVMIGSDEYLLADNVVKITADISSIIFVLTIIILSVLYLYNFIAFCTRSVARKKSQ